MCACVNISHAEAATLPGTQSARRSVVRRRVRVAAAHERSLEPCINGEVSATGKYVTQALKDRALEQAVTTQVAARKLRRYGLGE